MGKKAQQHVIPRVYLNPFCDPTAAGVPCTDATVAAIAATMFIAACRQEGI